MAEEHEPDPHQNRMELAAGDLVVLEITEKKDEHVGDDGRTEDEEGHHGPGGIVNERVCPLAVSTSSGSRRKTPVQMLIRLMTTVVMNQKSWTALFLHPTYW